MGDEYKEMYPHLYQQDSEVKLAFRNGLEGFKSDSVDFMLEHCALFPISLVLFYDS